ncbi:MAG: hypothetical protein MUQ67_02280, partial [Pirellulales bacterium]|nr:hypothetical protein [Pirellulales bacterium]
MVDPPSPTLFDELLAVAVISHTQFNRINQLIPSSSIAVFEKPSTCLYFYRFSLANNPPLLKPL